MNKPTDRIDNQPCSECKRSRFVALSMFGPDVYQCTLVELPVAANHSCSQWTPRTMKEPEQ